MEHEKRILKAVSTRLKEALKRRLKDGLYPILTGTNLMHQRLFSFPDKRGGVDYKHGPIITVDYISRLFNPKFYHHPPSRKIIREVPSSKAIAQFRDNEGGYYEVEGNRVWMEYDHPLPYEYYFMVSVWSTASTPEEADAIAEAIQHPRVLPERGYVTITLMDGRQYNWNMICGDVRELDFNELSRMVLAVDESRTDLYRVDMFYVVEGFSDPFLLGERVRTIDRFEIQMEVMGGTETEIHILEPTEFPPP